MAERIIETGNSLTVFPYRGPQVPGTRLRETALCPTVHHPLPGRSRRRGDPARAPRRTPLDKPLTRAAAYGGSRRTVHMIRIYADFNDKTADGGYWILQFDDMPIEEKITEMGLSSDVHVLLYQDGDDFEVEATLDYRFVDVIGREGWVAYPDWSTLTRKPAPA